MRLDSSPANSGFSEEHRLAWALFLTRACEKTGIYPLSLQTFHRLIYFANCLAQVYEYSPPSQLVMKQKWGPYYPNAQMDLDRLVLMGLVDISNLRWERSAQRTSKLADFTITESGFSLCTRLARDAIWFKEAESFLFDVCSAYTSIGDETADQASESDLTYSQKGVPAGSVIVFSEESRNPSARGARYFEHAAPSLAIPNRQHQLRLYMKFLEGKAA
jgi:hypothetical protein